MLCPVAVLGVRGQDVVMEGLSSPDVVALFLGFALLLGAARVLGGVARRVRQPAVLGEILAGILLGPTVLGQLAPAVGEHLFPASGPRAIVHEGMSALAITLFLLVAGMEVNLSAIWRQGRAALAVGWLGVAFPFALGLAAGLAAPDAMGMEPGTESLTFALFLAAALSISALPVIAKTLMDLGLYRTDLGMLIIAAAIFNDIAGWIIFAVVLGLMGAREGVASTLALPGTVAMTFGFALVVLTVGRVALDRTLRWIQARSRRPGAVMSFALAAALVCAAFTEHIGIHAVFGAFLFGVALGDSRHLREQTRTTMERFISFFFAPIFFASIGLRVDFAAHFELGLVLLVLGIACLGKVLGCGLGARLGGLSWPESWAVGFGMNARGAMEIILGLLALEAGLIGESMFVALVVMALVTSMLSGPAIGALLTPRTGRRSFLQHLPAGAFVGPLRARDRWEAIADLCSVAAELRGLDPDVVARAALARERTQGTGLPNGVAIPHAHIAGLSAPIVAAGVSSGGLDFDSPDGGRSHLVLLVLTAEGDGRSQLEIVADVAATFPDLASTAVCAQARDHAELVARVQLLDLRRRTARPRASRAVAGAS